MSKSYQTSTDKVGPHDSNYRGLLNPLSTASPSDPLEENFCFGCHSTTNNPNAGSNQDYYGVKAMSLPLMVSNHSTPKDSWPFRVTSAIVTSTRTCLGGVSRV